MDKIIEGVQRFQDEVYPQKRALFQRLALGQQPDTLFVACADSRVSLDLVTQAGPGDVFVCRNAGNIVPPYGRNDATAASIEYALAALPIRHIVVCGHSDCGAMKGLLSPDGLARLPQVREWLIHSEGALRALERDGIDTQAYDALPMVTRLNVRLQLENLRTHPQVFARVREGSLRLHGWVYNIATGEVDGWDPVEGMWSPVRDAVAAKAGRAGSLKVRHA